MSFHLPALLAATLAAAPTARAAGVLVVGRDVPPAAVAAAQAQLEARLGAGGIAVTGAIELGRTIGTAQPALDAKARAEAAARIEAGAAAHYAASLGQALRLLTEAAEIHEKAPAVPIADRILVALWRVTVLLATEDTRGAELAAREVVRLAPGYVVPLSTFPPTVKTFVEAQRAALDASTPVTFTGGQGLEVLFDDAPVAGRRVIAAPGKHWVRTRAAGVIENAWGVTVGTEPLAIALRPPVVALTPEDIAALGAPDGTAAFARQARVDSLAVVLLTPEGMRTRIWKGGETLSGSFGAGELGAAGAAILESLAPSRRGSRETASVAAGPVVAFATRSIRAGGIDPVALTLTGTGAALDLRLARGSLRGGIEARVVSFAPTQTTAVIGEVRAQAPGGVLAGGRASAGVAFAGGLAIPSAALSAERYQATELPIEQRVPLFVSQTRLAPELRLGSAIALGSVTLGAELGLAPVTWVSEDPAGTTGRSPRGGPDVDGRIVASKNLGRTWRGAVQLDAAGKRATYGGASSAGFDPPVEDATVNESFVGLTLSIARRF